MVAHADRRAQAGQGRGRALPAGGLLREGPAHVFPGHHSLPWGELALYSFLVLLVTGTFLALFFVPDTPEADYQGQHDDLRGLHLSRASEPVLDLPFEIRGGLLIRQIHHRAAHVFIGSIALHMFRNFSTGGFRKPRELTWLIGSR